MWLTGQNSQNMKIAKSGQIMDKMLKQLKFENGQK